MRTLRALCIPTLYGGSATRTSECSPVCNVEVEAAFRAAHDMLSARAQLFSLSLKQTIGKILKTFLHCSLHTEILTI